ncbi:hypothetical protein ebA4943 [Aromatoleum aromaticum EbN1]|uniref:Uncharacterized protein n=1 Tax=Aromatoleum aromaticum (strain DSM 19018 / LMG 30748 / EbN1) TaxID=76114 RepID=Q5P178_AROAE|nr:hypothetical protein ebA4943 [Aromatoleum aromaticum EbN1]
MRGWGCDSPGLLAIGCTGVWMFSSVTTTQGAASATLPITWRWCATWCSISSGSISPSRRASRPSGCWQQHPMSFGPHCSASKCLKRMRMTTSNDERVAAGALGADRFNKGSLRHVRRDGITLLEDVGVKFRGFVITGLSDDTSIRGHDRSLDDLAEELCFLFRQLRPRCPQRGVVGGGVGSKSAVRSIASRRSGRSSAVPWYVRWRFRSSSARCAHWRPRRRARAHPA